MATSEQQQEIFNLRERQLTPKQIARKLGLRPAEVKAVIKAGAIESEAERLARGEQHPLVSCWCDEDTYEMLIEASGDANTNLSGHRGLSIVTVIRSPRPPRCEIARYLVDYYCLGVKNAIPLRSLSENNIPAYLDSVYENMSPPVEISLREAQAIVLGAQQYAKSLGFDPHPDFERTRDFLDQWDGEPSLEFGREGKPCYIEGPYDDSQQIIKTLKSNVGKGKFDFVQSLNEDVFMDNKFIDNNKLAALFADL